MKNYKELKVLLVYQYFRNGINDFYCSHIKRLTDKGYDVKGFCLTIDPPGPRMTYPELNNRWVSKEKKLMNIYYNLKKACEDRDVLLLYNGANLHPEFLPELNTFNVYQCFDDPESSETLSKPVAKYFDACFVGNIASLQQYISWGCKNVHFRPLGFFENNISSSLKYINNKIDVTNRTLDVSLFCERESSWRSERLKFLTENLPNLYGRGRGWPGGYVSDKEMLILYAKTKIGLNIHNSTGPINLRTYVLPANGILQICDNKYFLGHIFKLNYEVVGFNEIEEVPELTNYYLKNDRIRKKIAYNGWLRAIKEYNEYSIWEKQMMEIGKLL